jgi:hypothetical protein
MKKNINSLVQIIKSRLISYKEITLTIMVISILIDILFLKNPSDIRFFGWILIYIFLIAVYALKSSFTFALVLILLVIMYGSFLISGTSVYTERTAVWFVLIFVVALFQKWRELFR